MLSEKQGKSLQEIVEAAVENYRRQALLAEANAAYARLGADPLRDELAGWNGTLGDGLDTL